MFYSFRWFPGPVMVSLERDFRPERRRRVDRRAEGSVEFDGIRQNVVPTVREPSVAVSSGERAAIDD